MSFSIRIANGSVGGAIALRDADGQEQYIPVFSDAWIRTFTLFGHSSCLLASDRNQLALLDISRREITARTRLDASVDKIAVSPEGRTAIAYGARSFLFFVLELPQLEQKKKYNLARKVANETHELIYYNESEFYREHKRFFSDLNDKESDYRKISLSRDADPVFRDERTVIAPVSHAQKDLPFTIYFRTGPGESHLWRYWTEVAELDLANDQILYKPIRNTVGTETHIRLLSPDGRHAVLQSLGPVATSTGARKSANPFVRAVFDRRNRLQRAYGLELWDIVKDQPELKNMVAFHLFENDGILPINTANPRYKEDHLYEAEIDLIVSGLVTVLSGGAADWHSSHAKRREDRFFAPQETGENPPTEGTRYALCGHPMFFGKVMHRLLEANPSFPSGIPWKDLTDRHRGFLYYFLKAWSAHSRMPTFNMIWSDDGHSVLALGQDGTAREISFAEGPGPAWHLMGREEITRKYAALSSTIQTRQIGGRAFSVDLPDSRIEFAIPANVTFGSSRLHETEASHTERIGDKETKRLEIKAVNQIVAKTRAGYVTAKSKSVSDLIDGVCRLSKEVEQRFEEIVVSSSWTPSVYFKESEITETDFCDRLSRDGSDAAVEALLALLKAYLKHSSSKNFPALHIDGEIPALGPTALALLKTATPVPAEVLTFLRLREVYHDVWIHIEFRISSLPTERLLESDVWAISLTLALQDYAHLGNGHGPVDLLQPAQSKMIKSASTTEIKAISTIFLEQMNALWPNYPWEPGSEAERCVQRICSALEKNGGTEQVIARNLRAAFPLLAV
ncbi:hypothetical protein LP7551_05307 [Roseibium album]|nr:hypothetical protein LP7551_05307 [Roseibium album]